MNDKSHYVVKLLIVTLLLVDSKSKYTEPVVLNEPANVQFSIVNGLYAIKLKPATFYDVALTVMLNNKLAIVGVLVIVGAKNVNELDYITIFEEDIQTP